MTDDIASKVKSVTESLSKSAVSIKEICKPLRNIGVDDFFFMRVYNDGSIIDLATHVPWGEYFFEQLYSLEYAPNEIKDHIFLYDNVSLWEHNPDNRIWRDGKTHFSAGNGVSITKKFETYNEVFGFYSSKENYKINQFYINNLDIFDKFIEYFSHKAKPLIKAADKKRIIIPQKYAQTQDMVEVTGKDVKDFLKEINLKNKNAEGMTQSLTKRENEILEWLAMGKTSEEIGMILEASKRTIESHVYNMKVKFNFTKSIQLVTFAAKNGLI